jgi:uroporphyrinogen decarboxylase
MAERLQSARQGFVQGNFDQVLLFADDIENRISQYLRPLANLSPEQRAGFVCGLGHGVLPQTPERHVRLFVDQVRRELE